MSFFTKTKQDEKSLLIVSTKQDVYEEIRQRLNIQGVNKFEFIQKDLTQINSDEISDNHWAVVCDIGPSTDASKYADTLLKLFAKDMAKVIVGESDSIALKQNFLKRGLTYLHLNSEVNEIYPSLIKFDQDTSGKHSIKIAILGAKGGVGASFTAYHIARLIYERFKVPTLLVQSATSSLNIDILSGVNFDKEHINPNGLSLYRQNSDDAFDFENHKFKRFNFIIYDYSVGALEKEMCEHILNNSDTAIVLSDASVASVRKAKELLKINRFLKSVNKGAARIMLYINEPYKNSAKLDKTQIESIAEAKIDLNIPYAGFSELNSSLNKRSNSSFELAIDSLTGSKKANKFWLFKAR